jgi:hypothetical protein
VAISRDILSIEDEADFRDIRSCPVGCSSFVLAAAWSDWELDVLEEDENDFDEDEGENGFMRGLTKKRLTKKRR